MAIMKEKQQNFLLEIEWQILHTEDTEYLKVSSVTATDQPRVNSATLHSRLVCHLRRNPKKF